MRKQTSKLVASLAIIALMFGLLPTGMVYAAVGSSMSSASGYAGDTVSISYSIASTIEVLEAELNFAYDSTKLELVSVVDNTGKANMVNGTKLAYLDMTGNSITLSQGKVATATFKIAEGATGDAVVSAEMYYSDLDDNYLSTSANSKVTIKVAANSISLDKSTLSLERGAKSTLVATVDPSNTTEDIVWSSSNTSVATVNNVGEVTAVGAGTATITAKVGGKSATCRVTVLAPITKVSLNKTEMTLVKGQTGQLTVSYEPTVTTDDASPVWKSENSAVATVRDGVVTAVSAGTTNIVVTISGKTATCKVTVTDVPLRGIEINKDDFELLVGDSENLSVIFNPNDTTDDKTVTWTTSNSDVVSVENGKVTALKIGTATITAKVGNHTDTVVITVPEVLIEGITLTADTTKLEVGGTTQLTLTVTPEKVTEEVVATYTSSDENVLTVDENGKVTAVALGKAVVKVSVNGKVETTLEFEVVEKVNENTNNGGNNSNVGGTTNNGGTTNKKPSVLPATGDISIGTMVILAVVSLAGIIVFVKRTRK